MSTSGVFEPENVGFTRTRKKMKEDRSAIAAPCSSRNQKAAHDGGLLCAAASLYLGRHYADVGRRDAAALGLKLVLIVGITSSFLRMARGGGISPARTV
jgi:hypothetical protein